MMKAMVNIVAAWVILGSLPATADEVTVDGVKLELPAPEEFVRLDGVNPSYDRLAQSSLPKTNQFLAFYGTPGDLKLLEGGGVPRQERNFNAQALHPKESFSVADFAKVVEVTEREQEMSAAAFQRESQKLAERTGKTLAEMTDSEVSFEMGAMKPLGMLGKGDDWFSFGMKMSMSVQGAGGQEQVDSTTVVAFVHAGSKIVALYGTDLTGEDDVLEGLKEETWTWRDAVLAANSAVPKAAKSRGFDWSKVWGGAAAGAVIGGLVALVMGLVRKKGKAA